MARNITLSDLKEALFPNNFYHKYRYLGNLHRIQKDDKSVIEPLIVLMDNLAKPSWCPRFVLRLLYLFGSTNTPDLVRNKFLFNLKLRLTKEIMFFDCKFLWGRDRYEIVVNGPKKIKNLAKDLEELLFMKFHTRLLITSLSKIDEISSKQDINKIKYCEKWYLFKTHRLQQQNKQTT